MSTARARPPALRGSRTDDALGHDALADAPEPSREVLVTRLQRAGGNRAVAAMLTRHALQRHVGPTVDQRIQRNSFRVRHDGMLSAEHRVVAKDLPLPIAL